MIYILSYLCIVVLETRVYYLDNDIIIIIITLPIDRNI